MTVSSPRTSTGFVDRFLVTAEAYGIPTTLVLNKVDTMTESDIVRAGELSEIYGQAGYPWLEVSAKTGGNARSAARRWPTGFTCCPALGRGQKHLDQPFDPWIGYQNGRGK